jgi:hypothetical protein
MIQQVNKVNTLFCEEKDCILGPPRSMDKAAEKRPCLPAGRHLRRYPVASPYWRRGRESLLIRRDALRPSRHLDGVAGSRSLFVTTPSGRLTISAAWQKVAPYSSQRHPLILCRVRHGAGLLRRTTSSMRHRSVLWALGSPFF